MIVCACFRYQLVDFGLAHLESQSRDERGKVEGFWVVWAWLLCFLGFFFY